VTYCVVPREIASEVFEALSNHYSGEGEVTVIVDRRHSERRHSLPAGAVGRQQRVLRDRRRRRISGELPTLYGEASAPPAE